jgi:hypothetical protein
MVRGNVAGNPQQPLVRRDLDALAKPMVVLAIGDRHDSGNRLERRHADAIEQRHGRFKGGAPAVRREFLEDGVDQIPSAVHAAHEGVGLGPAPMPLSREFEQLVDFGCRLSGQRECAGKRREAYGHNSDSQLCRRSSHSPPLRVERRGAISVAILGQPGKLSLSVCEREYLEKIGWRLAREHRPRYTVQTLHSPLAA